VRVKKNKNKKKWGEELIENKVSFYDAFQGLEAARNYIHQFDVEENSDVQ